MYKGNVAVQVKRKSMPLSVEIPGDEAVGPGLAMCCLRGTPSFLLGKRRVIHRPYLHF